MNQNDTKQFELNVLAGILLLLVALKYFYVLQMRISPKEIV